MDFSTTKVQSLSIIVLFSQRKWYWMWSNFHDQKLIQVSGNLLLSCWLWASLQIISYPLSDVFFCALFLLFFETDKRSCSTLKLLTAFTNIFFKAVTINVPKYVQASLHRCAFSWIWIEWGVWCGFLGARPSNIFCATSVQNLWRPVCHIFATAFMTHFEKMVQGDVQRLCKQESAGTTLEAAEKQRIPINQKLNNWRYRARRKLEQRAKLRRSD